MKLNHATCNRVLEVPNDILLSEIIRLLEAGCTVTLQLKGNSMRPFLEDNRDRALIRRAVNPRVGDPVLALTLDKRYVLHRIVRIDNNLVTLRGDGNIGTEKCRLEDVKGSVIGFYRKGRTKLDRTDGIKWKAYSWIWIHAFPIRRYLLAAYSRIWIPLFGAI